VRHLIRLRDWANVVIEQHFGRATELGKKFNFGRTTKMEVFCVDAALKNSIYLLCRYFKLRELTAFCLCLTND
jgi:hypothetical protein